MLVKGATGVSSRFHKTGMYTGHIFLETLLGSGLCKSNIINITKCLLIKLNEWILITWTRISNYISVFVSEERRDTTKKANRKLVSPSCGTKFASVRSNQIEILLWYTFGKFPKCKPHQVQKSRDMVSFRDVQSTSHELSLSLRFAVFIVLWLGAVIFPISFRVTALALAVPVK